MGPSAGSIYPTLQQLEDEGLVRAEEREGRRDFTLTERGATEAAKFSGAAAPWNMDRPEDETDVRKLIGQVVQAAVQVYEVGTPKARAEAERILAGARRSLYQVLATDGAESEVPAAEPQAPDTETGQ